MTVNLSQVDYQQLDAVARRFQQESEAVSLLQQQMRARTADLCGRGWQGQGAIQFQDEMDHQILPSLGRMAQALALSAQTLQTMMQIFRQAEEEAAALYRQEDQLAGLRAEAGGSASGLLYNLLQNSDFIKLLLDNASNGLKVLRYLAQNFSRSEVREAMRELGRLLNKLGNTEGFVGKMDDLYRSIFVKGIPYNGDLNQFFLEKNSFSQIFDKGLKFAEVLAGTLDDVAKGTYGDNWFKAGGVNITKSLVEFAIEKAHPDAWVAFAVNWAVQLEGKIENKITATVANLFVSDPATRDAVLQMLDTAGKGLESGDLGNVTHRLAEGIVNYKVAEIQGYYQTGMAILNGTVDMIRDPSVDTLYRVNTGVMRTYASGVIHAQEVGLRGTLNTLAETSNFVTGLLTWKANTETAQRTIIMSVAGHWMPPDMSSAWQEALRKQSQVYAELSKDSYEFMQIDVEE